MREITITANDSGQRLDKFITKYMPLLPQSLLYKGLRKNCVRVNGTHVRDGKRMLNAGDTLTLYFKDEFFSTRTFTPVDCSDLKIIYEDANIMLLDKPVGISSHADEDGGVTLVDKIKSRLYRSGEYNPDAEHSFAPALCNRLDRNTGGMIIAAKNAAALREMNEKIRLRKVEKHYLCVADGVIKSDGVIEGYLTRGDKRVSVSYTPSDGAKYIRTEYAPIADNGDTTLLDVTLATGRTHQIRASLALIGHPLTGDKKYGSKSDGAYRLYSYKLIFSDEADGGLLDYLSGREFVCGAELVKKFSSQKR